ncbi:MAG: DUF6174 domain-containing protein [Acidimicrobiia bacterium]|nr:DUF6174 domain-containing protein [Acidimicrobiia bacterium]
MRIRLLIVALVVLTAACGSSGQTAGTDGQTAPTTTGPTGTSTPTTTAVVPDGTEQGALDAARARWDEVALVDYRYVLRRSCECDVEWVAPHTVVVRAGEVVHQQTAYGDEPPEGALMSIDEIFDRIQRAIDAGTDNQVEYDDVSGAPLDVQLDLPGIAADGGFALSVDFDDQTDELAELAAARARWDGAGIGDYQLRYQVNCFCPRAVVTVDVVDGAIETVAVEPHESAPVDRGRTVDDLFDVVAHAYDTGAASVTVAYHADTGYPVEYFVDVHEMMADEEHGVTVLALAATG